MTVDSIVPLYHRVYTALRQQLLEGRHPPARSMPGEPQLARAFGVARVTVRRALQQLEAEGLVVRRASRGTYATNAASPAEARANISGLLENLVTVGRGTRARLLSFDTVPSPPDIAARLGAPVGMALVCLKRLVRDDAGRPIEYHESLYRPDRYEYRLNLVRGGTPSAPAWMPLADAGQ